MQEEIRKIMKKFKQHDLYIHSRNKENQYRTSGNNIDHNSNKDQVARLTQIIYSLETTIQSLITDGNKAFRHYQELLNESLLQIQNTREQLNNFKESAAQEKGEFETLIEDLNAKIEVLNLEIVKKEDLYHDLYEKYEILQEKASEVQHYEQQTIKQIQKELVRESFHYEEKIIVTNQQNDQIKMKLIEVLKINEEMQEQLNYIKTINEELMQNVDYLRNKLDTQRHISYQTHNGCIEELQRCDLESIERDEERFTLEEIKMNDSQEMNTSREKQILNISEHYSKLNRTEEYCSKEREYYDYLITDSNETKSFVRRRQFAQQTKNLLKIDTIQSKNEQVHSQSRVITQIKEFKMPESSNQTPSVDPYHAFFLLTAQCQKMNSPHFDAYSQIDLSDLYRKFIDQGVAYTQWRIEIEKALASRVRQNLQIQ